jgi:Kelch motif
VASRPGRGTDRAPEPAAVGAEIYLVGGYRRDGATVPTVEVFQPASGRWRRGPDLPVAVNHAMATTGGGGGACVRRHYGGRQAERGRGGAGADGRVSTIGGRAAGRGNLDAVEVFDPASSGWSSLPSLPTARGGLGAAAADGFVVAVGGEGAATFREAEAFDVTGGTWHSLPPMPTPRHGLGVAAIGTVLSTLSGGRQPGLHVAASAEALDLAPLRP